jgi:hypothetical protein
MVSWHGSRIFLMLGRIFRVFRAASSYRSDFFLRLAA